MGVHCFCRFRDQRKQFQVLVENKFYEWLINTGHRQQLDSLVPPASTPLDPLSQDP